MTAGLHAQSLSLHGTWLAACFDDRAVAPTAATVATRVVAVPHDGGLAFGSFGPVFGARLARRLVDPARRRLPPRAAGAAAAVKKASISSLPLGSLAQSLLSLPPPSGGEKSSLLCLPAYPAPESSRGQTRPKKTLEKSYCN